MNHNIHPRISVWLLVSVAMSLSAGCASTNARTSATWLAAAANGVKEKAARYKEQRDALAKARQMSVNALEQSAVELEATTSTTMAFWNIPDSSKNQQKFLFDWIIAQSEAAEKRQRDWEQLRLEQEEKVAKARSSVASVGDKLGATTKLLSALGKETDFQEQVQDYVAFFTAVNESLQKLEEDAKKKQEEGSKAAESKTQNLVDSVNELDSKDEQ
jgi:hypothetical protein